MDILRYTIERGGRSKEVVGVLFLDRYPHCLACLWEKMGEGAFTLFIGKMIGESPALLVDEEQAVGQEILCQTCDDYLAHVVCCARARPSFEDFDAFQSGIGVCAMLYGSLCRYTRQHLLDMVDGDEERAALILHLWRWQDRFSPLVDCQAPVCVGRHEQIGTLYDLLALPPVSSVEHVRENIAEAYARDVAEADGNLLSAVHDRWQKASKLWMRRIELVQDAHRHYASLDVPRQWCVSFHTRYGTTSTYHTAATPEDAIKLGRQAMIDDPFKLTDIGSFTAMVYRPPIKRPALLEF